MTLNQPQTMPFISGFQPIELPFIRCPAMKPFRISARVDLTTNTLIISRDQKWNRDDTDQKTESDEEEFHPATDPEVQVAFLTALSEKIKYYNDQLIVCCMRRDSGAKSDADIGFYNTYQ